MVLSRNLFFSLHDIQLLSKEKIVDPGCITLSQHMAIKTTMGYRRKYPHKDRVDGKKKHKKTPQTYTNYRRTVLK